MRISDSPSPKNITALEASPREKLSHGSGPVPNGSANNAPSRDLLRSAGFETFGPLALATSGVVDGLRPLRKRVLSVALHLGVLEQL